MDQGELVEFRAIVLAAIIELWPDAQGSLERETLNQYLLDEGITPPDGALDDALQSLANVGFIYCSRPRPSSVHGYVKLIWLNTRVLPQ